MIAKDLPPGTMLDVTLCGNPWSVNIHWAINYLYRCYYKPWEGKS